MELDWADELPLTAIKTTLSAMKSSPHFQGDSST
jgi:hypothetical protein